MVVCPIHDTTVTSAIALHSNSSIHISSISAVAYTATTLMLSFGFAASAYKGSRTAAKDGGKGWGNHGSGPKGAGKGQGKVQGSSSHPKGKGKGKK